MSSRTDKSKKYWQLYTKILKMKGTIFYMKYARILILALIEIIAEMYNKNKDRR